MTLSQKLSAFSLKRWLKGGPKHAIRKFLTFLSSKARGLGDVKEENARGRSEDRPARAMIVALLVEGLAPSNTTLLILIRKVRERDKQNERG